MKVLPKLAASADASPSRDNFAYVDTVLVANSAVIVELTALKQPKPLRIILTTERPHKVYACGNFTEILGLGNSVEILSQVLTAQEELAVGIKPSGTVCIKHGNREWADCTQVNPMVGYNVVFDMENISVLSMIGLTNGEDHIEESPVIPSEDTSKNRGHNLPECIVCCDDSRDVVFIPCFHVAVCSSCSSRLMRMLPPKCPCCRETVNQVQKLYMA